MKKVSLFLSCLLIGATTLFVSCDKKDDPAPDKEVVPDDNGTENGGEDSTELVLNYSVACSDDEIYASTPATVKIDINAIAKHFGLDKDDLGNTLNGKGSVEVSCLAINNSTNTDTLIRSNTDYYWGYYWDQNGDVTEAANATLTSLFRYDSNEGTAEIRFIVRQNYEAVSQGMTIAKAIEYQGKRVKIIISITGQNYNAEENIIASNTLTIDYTLRKTPTETPVEGFNATTTLSKLGASSWDDVTWIAYGANGFTTQDSHWMVPHDAQGYTYNPDGIADGYYSSSVGVFFYEGKIYVQAMSLFMKPEPGTTLTLRFAASYNNKIVDNVITINFKEFVDTETKPTGEPESKEYNLTLSLPFGGGSEPYDIKEYLRQCFKMTTYQIFNALYDDEIKMWNGEVNQGDGYPSQYLTAEGNIDESYDNTAIGLYFGGDEEHLTFSCLSMEKLTTNIKTIKTKAILEKDGITATFNLTINIE